MNISQKNIFKLELLEYMSSTPYILNKYQMIWIELIREKNQNKKIRYTQQKQWDK